MNPVDDLFSKKLKDFEVKPSERANVLFAEKLANRNKGSRKMPLMIWFSMAASLVLVSLVGLYFFKNDKPKNQELASKVLPIESDVNGDKSNTSDRGFVTSPTLKTEIGTSRNHKLDNTVEQFAKKVGENSLALEQNLAIENPIETSISQEPNKIIATTDNSKSTDVAKNVFNSETVIFLTPLMSLNQINSIAESKRPLKIPDVVENSDYFSEDKTLFTRVIEEVKNLKKGEKVDFNKLGFKPIEELAINQDGFIVSETRQIKEKLNWVRARLNNN